MKTASREGVGNPWNGSRSTRRPAAEEVAFVFQMARSACAGEGLLLLEGKGAMAGEGLEASSISVAGGEGSRRWRLRKRTGRAGM
jgi:hypothetical protein